MASEGLSEMVALQRNENMKSKKNSFKESFFGIFTLLIAPNVRRGNNYSTGAAIL